MGTFDDGADMLTKLRRFSQENAQTEFLDWVWKRLRIDWSKIENNDRIFQADMEAVKKRLDALEADCFVPPAYPADYPRCTTCRHWAGSPEKTMRYACRKMENSQPVISCHLHGETRYYPLDIADIVSITTKPDFGCVHHSELTGAKNNG